MRDARRLLAICVMTLALATGCETGAKPANAIASHMTRVIANPCQPSSGPVGAGGILPQSHLDSLRPVTAVRYWACAFADGVNRGDRTMSYSAKFSTPDQHVADIRAGAATFGLRFPGPVPFTPLSVTGDGSRMTVAACMIASGFANRSGREPPTSAGEQKVAVDFVLERVNGAWILSQIVPTTAFSCTKVLVIEFEF